MNHPKMIQISATFRRSEPVAATHEGKTIWYAVCEQFFNGQWERFIQLRAKGAQ